MEVKYNNKENSLNNKYWLRKLRSYNYNYVKYFSVPVGECQILSTQGYNCLARWQNNKLYSTLKDFHV